jgi:hypothetical protein
MTDSANNMNPSGPFPPSWSVENPPSFRGLVPNEGRSLIVTGTAHMGRMFRWYVVPPEGRQLPKDDNAGERVAARMQEEFAKLHPEGLEGKRVVFKWDNGRLWFACIPTYPHNITITKTESPTRKRSLH